MSFLENILRCKRSRVTSFIALTVVLVIFNLIQMKHLNSYLHVKFRKKPDIAEKVVKINHTVDFTGEKLIHFDLKGAPPKISYLLNLLPFLKKLGATGILVEYEDMFPYHSGLEEIAALNAYTLSDIAAIVKTAQLNNLSVVPLIPTLGHLEFVLKHERFREFREMDEDPFVLCPSQTKVYALLEKMIDQVLNAHNSSKYLHIGCDEVALLGLCPRCKKLMGKKRWHKNVIYFNHMQKIAEYVTTTHPGVKPIVWCAKFSKYNTKVITRHKIPDLVDVMFWPKKYDFPPIEDMESFAELFKNVWIASNFKGGTENLQIVTDTDYYLTNSIMQMKFFEKWKEKLNVKGIAMIGWQRQNHFTGLNELFPVGIPSLALNLQTLTHGQGSGKAVVKHSLKCRHSVPVTLKEIQNSTLLSKLWCDFPGFNIYRQIHSYYTMLHELKTSLNKNYRDDLTYYSILHSASNPTFIHQLKKAHYERHFAILEDLQGDIKAALEEVYDQYTINEWISTHMLPVRLHLEAIVNTVNALSRVRVWSRRPLENIDALMKETFNKICNSSEIRGCSFFNVHI